MRFFSFGTSFGKSEKILIIAAKYAMEILF